MATTGAQGLRRQSISSVRARYALKTIEAAIGRTIGGSTSDYTTSEKIPGKQALAVYNGTRLAKAKK